MHGSGVNRGKTKGSQGGVLTALRRVATADYGCLFKSEEKIYHPFMINIIMKLYEGMMKRI
jgi:hypothetical protein